MAAKAKRPTIDGRHMLVHQGALAFKLFTGRRAPIDVMSKAIGIIFFAMLLLVGAVISGLGGIWTALLGGLLIEFMPDLATAVIGSRSFPGIAYGVMLIAMIYLMPQGLAGVLDRWRSKIRN